MQGYEFPQQMHMQPQKRVQQGMYKQIQHGFQQPQQNMQSIFSPPTLFTLLKDYMFMNQQHQGQQQPHMKQQVPNNFQNMGIDRNQASNSLNLRSASFIPSNFPFSNNNFLDPYQQQPKVNDFFNQPNAQPMQKYGQQQQYEQGMMLPQGLSQMQQLSNAYKQQYPKDQELKGYQQTQKYQQHDQQVHQGQESSFLQQGKSDEQDQLINYILMLKNPQKRENALIKLNESRENFKELAPLLWYSVGTVALMLHEIVQIYQKLSPPNLSYELSDRVCNVLGLLQALALHPQTRNLFVKAQIPLFLYPFLNTTIKQRPYENLRVTSLGVIGALVKGDDQKAITFLRTTEIIPLCLRIMRRGEDLSRTVATFIVQKMLSDKNGLEYICGTAERFFAVSAVLQNMVDEIFQNGKISTAENQRLLMHIIRCYLRLSENTRANEALRKGGLPEHLKKLDTAQITDKHAKKYHQDLLENLQEKVKQRDP